MKTLGIVLAISVLINIILLSVFLNARKNTDTTPPASHDEYPLLSKRIFAETQNDLLINFVPLRTAIRSYFGNIPEEIGVYFEYLPTGTSIGVNEQYEVRFASLIKIPVVMAIYKQIEEGILTENTTITIEEKDMNDEFGNLWQRGPGTKVTVREAVYLSIVESDNTATAALTRLLSQGAIDAVFDGLDIPKDTEGGLPVISPKNYSSILRSLYLAAYINKEHSSYILDLMTKTRFQDRIATGVSEKVKVAHKIGVYNRQNSERIYSDCGIFYVPNRPYILCVMTNANEEKANEYMSYISKMIYGYITTVNK